LEQLVVIVPEAGERPRLASQPADQSRVVGHRVRSLDPTYHRIPALGPGNARIPARTRRDRGARRRLLQGMLDPLLRPRPDGGVVHQDAGAGVPAQDRVVVSGRTEGLGFLVEGHRLPETVIGHVTRPGAALLELGLGPALPDDPRIVGALV